MDVSDTQKLNPRLDLLVSYLASHDTLHGHSTLYTYALSARIEIIPPLPLHVAVVSCSLITSHLFYLSIYLFILSACPSPSLSISLFLPVSLYLRLPLPLSPSYNYLRLSLSRLLRTFLPSPLSLSPPPLPSPSPSPPYLTISHPYTHPSTPTSHLLSPLHRHSLYLTSTPPLHHTHRSFHQTRTSCTQVWRRMEYGDIQTAEGER